MSKNIVYDAVTGQTVETPLTPEQVAEIVAWDAGAYQRDYDAVTFQRQAAYVAESDPLNFTWQETGLDIDRVAWLEKKDEIKARYPYPVKVK